MEVIYLLIPVSLVLIGVIVWIFVWAIRSGQFDDLEGPAHRILLDDDDSIKTDTDTDTATGGQAARKNGEQRRD